MLKYQVRVEIQLEGGDDIQLLEQIIKVFT